MIVGAMPCIALSKKCAEAWQLTPGVAPLQWNISVFALRSFDAFVFLHR